VSDEDAAGGGVMNRLRRSVLFMPGDNARKIEKAARLPCDCVAIDLEDGVAASQKALAREVTASALRGIDFGARERLVRLNPASSDLHSDDLRETLLANPDGYIIPKVETPDDVREISHRMDKIAIGLGVLASQMRLWAVIETALGVMNLREIAQASPRLTALMFGAEDYAASVGATRTERGEEVLFARSAVVAAAAAYGLDAIDLVRFDLADPAGLEAECRFGRQLGYAGKMAIHPGQLDVINRAFSPNPDEIARAGRIVSAAAQYQAAGLGAFALDGRMIDAPVVKSAENVLARARAAGLI
jgi:citrate lyase beta subunit